MPEKPHGPTPEQSQPEKTVLTEEQIAYADQIYNRLFETFFSGVELTNITKFNQQLKSERYNQLVRLIDKGFHDLTQDQKNLIKKNTADKINLYATPTEDEVAPKKTPKESAFIKQVRETQEEQHFPLNDDYRIPEPPKKEQSVNEKKDHNIVYPIDKFIEIINEKVGTKIEKTAILDCIRKEITGVRKTKLIEEQLLFSDVDEKRVESFGRIKLKYIFYFTAPVRSGNSKMKCELSLKGFKQNGIETVGINIFMTAIK